MVTRARRATTTGRLSVESWWLAVAPLAFVAVFFAWPLLALVTRALTSASGSALPWGRIADAVATTITLAALGTGLTLAIGLPATWALFRRSWRGARVVTAIATVPFVLPTVVVATAFRALTRDVPAAQSSTGLMTTIVAALVFFNVAVVVRVVGPVWAQLDERQYWAARVLGASHRRAVWHAQAPALAPAILAAAATVWLFCAASFGVVIVLGSGAVATVDTEIWLQANHFLNLRAAAVLALLQVLAVSTALLVAARLKSRSGGVGVARDASAPPPVTGGKGRAALAAALAPSLLLFATPLAALTWRSLGGPGSLGLGFYARLASAEPVAGMSVSALDAAARSLVTAAVTAIVATGFALGIAIVTTRRKGGRAAYLTVLLPLGVSSIVVGLGSLLTLTRPLPGGVSLVEAGALIPAAHIVIALPLAATALVPALRAVEPRLRAAAATLGAPPWRVFTQVEWPLIRRSVAMAAGLAAAVSLGEFGATALLTRPDAATLPTLIFHLLGRPGPDNVGMAFAASVVLALATGAIAWAADAPTPRSVGAGPVGPRPVNSRPSAKAVR